MTAQLDIPGIGQQLATLAEWKAQNKIYTQMINSEDYDWSAWDEIESPHEFGSKFGFDCMGLGNSEKEAILNYCGKQNIDPPFWW